MILGKPTILRACMYTFQIRTHDQGMGGYQKII